MIDDEDADGGQIRLSEGLKADDQKKGIS